MSEVSASITALVRRALHSARVTKLPAVRLPSARLIVRIVGPIVVIAAFVMLYVESTKYGQLAKIAKVAPELNGATYSEPSSSHDAYGFLKGELPEQATGIAFSPLERIKTYNENMEKKRKASWDFLGRNNRYKKFDDLSEESQCYFYFHNLYEINPKWENNYSKWGFIVNDEEEERLSTVAEDTKEAIRSRKRQNDIALGLERMRMYETCFLDRKDADMSKMFSNIRNSGNSFSSFTQWDFEKRMWPFIREFDKNSFSELIPHFTSPDGVALEAGHLPPLGHSSDYIKKAIKYEYNEKRSFMWNWNHMSSLVAQKGIVLSFGDGQLKHASRLIAHLRYIGNKLPLQVIHKGDLSEDSIKALQKIAQSDDITFPETDYEGGQNVKQELWFVDVSPTLNPVMAGSFTRFKNKWLATSFNLFEEFVLIDVDTVHYVDLDQYFHSVEYQHTGTLFFRDRYSSEKVQEICPAMIETLPPNILESYYFGHYRMVDLDYIERMCEKELAPNTRVIRSYFIDNLRHQMDSGLVAVNKKSHIVPLMLSAMLHMTDKLGSCSYGDKEFFWLGFYAMGHNFAFSDMPAGAVGIQKEDKNVNHHLQQKKSEICTIIIAHLSTEGNLLWANGGAEYCKFENAAEDDWKSEKLNMKSKYSSLEELKSLYKSSVSVKSGIVPMDKQGAWGSQDGRCRGYSYCARYERYIKPFSFNKMYEKGILIDFHPDLTTKYDAINKVWAGEYLSKA